MVVALNTTEGFLIMTILNTSSAATALGYKKGTKLHTAATLYLGTKGATGAQIVAKVGGPQLNMLKKIQDGGLGNVVKTTRNVKGKNVKVYTVTLTAKGKAAMAAKPAKKASAKPAKKASAKPAAAQVAPAAAQVAPAAAQVAPAAAPIQA